MELMETFIGKKYRLKTSENFDEYLKYIGVGLIARKTACAVTPVTVLSREGNEFTLTMSTTFRTIVFSFKPDEEFDEDRPDGRKLKSKVVIEDNRLIHTQVESNGRKSKHVRIFTPESLTVESTAEGWDGKCVRVYEAIK